MVWVGVIWVSCWAWSGAAEGSSEKHGASAAIDVSVKTIGADALYGQLAHLSRDGLELRGTDGADRAVPLEEVVRITVHATPSDGEGPATETRGTANVVDASAPARQQYTLTLHNGDVLHGDLRKAQDEAVVIETVDAGAVRFPLSHVSGLASPRAAQPVFRQSVQWLNHLPTDADDRVLLTNGDVVRGVITSIGPDVLGIAGEAGETAIAMRLVVSARLAASVMSPDDDADGAARKTDPSLADSAPYGAGGSATQPESETPADGRTPLVALWLRDSGRLTVAELDWSGDVVRAALATGQKLTLEAQRITRVDVIGGRWEWLSSHRPISFEHTPMLSLPWDYRVDRNVFGGPIVVGGERFERGLGVHSRARLAFDLQGRYRTFVTYFGLDDVSGPLAEVSVTILVDDRPRFEQNPVEPGELFGPIRVDTTGAKTLELLVDFGANGDIQDRFNWVEPALIR